MKRVLLSGFIIAILFLGLSTFVFAQDNPFDIKNDLPEPFEDTISLRILPLIPQAKEAITVEVTSLLLKLDQASITWFVNGKEFQKGTGLTKIRTTAGAEGVTMSIRAVVVSGGKQYIQSTTVTTGSVDLIWEAHSYTPPFYKGKALFPFQGEVTVAAIPSLVENGVRLDSKKLIYTWKANGDLLKDSSGYGKDSVTVRGGVIVRPIEISVTVSSVSGKTVSTSKVLIGYTSPKIIFYEEKPLFGPLYHQALSSSIDLKNSEIWIKAAPYFFSTSQPHKDPGLSYDWRIGGILADQHTNTIILRQAGTGAGQSTISTKVTSATKVLQSTDSSLIINFKSQ